MRGFGRYGLCVDGPGGLVVREAGDWDTSRLWVSQVNP